MIIKQEMKVHRSLKTKDIVFYHYYAFTNTSASDS